MLGSIEQKGLGRPQRAKLLNEFMYAVHYVMSLVPLCSIYARFRVLSHSLPVVMDCKVLGKKVD